MNNLVVVVKDQSWLSPHQFVVVRSIKVRALPQSVNITLNPVPVLSPPVNLAADPPLESPQFSKPLHLSTNPASSVPVNSKKSSSVPPPPSKSTCPESLMKCVLIFKSSWLPSPVVTWITSVLTSSSTTS